MSLENVSIQLIVALHRETGSNFSRCSIKRKAVFRPIYENQLAVAPPCWICQMDQPTSVDAYLPKWKFKDLLEVDLVYFVKRYWALDNKWNIAKVQSIGRYKDVFIIKARTKDCNFSNEKLSLYREETSFADDMVELLKRMKVVDAIDKQIIDVNDTPAANTRLMTNCKVCCCVVYCELKLHVPARLLQEEMPLAMDTDMVSINTLHAMEEEDVPSGYLVGSLSLFSLVISVVFRQ